MDQTIKKEGDFWVYETKHRFYYKTHNPVPVKDVIIALQGLEGILGNLPKALQTLTGINVDGSQFLVQSIESGSLTEDIIVKFFFKDKENFDKCISRLGENKMLKGCAIGLIIAALAGYGLHWATSTTSNPGTNITATNSIIIQNGAGVLNIEPETFKKAIETALPNKKQAALDAIKFILPAQDEKGASISISSADLKDKIEFNSDTLIEVPKKLELEANERVEFYENVKLQIRATNLDSKSTGWAGKIASRDDRLPIILSPEIDSSEIFGREFVYVDANLVFQEKGKSRELKASKIHVLKIIKK